MKKYSAVIIIVFIVILVAAIPVYATVKAPSVSVSYSNETSGSVDVTLTWDDFGSGDYHADWADSMLSDGSDLDYHDIDDDSITTSSGKKTLTKTGLTKFKNYYFRVAHADGSTQAASNVRVFPVDTGAARKTNEYGHGNFNSNTAMCGYCHSNHASLKEQLIQQATYYQLCKLCHGTASTQSKYDVEGGRVTVAMVDPETGEPSLRTTVPSLAGPFVEGATSIHNSDDSSPGWGPVVVPGSDSSKTLSMTCISCHSGHAGNNDNYRLLRKNMYVDDAKTESLKTVNIDFIAFAITPSNLSGEQLYMVRGNTEFCSSCHLDYDDGNARQAGRDSRLTTSEAVYRHPTTVGNSAYSVFGTDGSINLSPSNSGLLPLQYNAQEAKEGITDKRTSVVCSTCHFAHGTTKQFNTEMGMNQYILRLDNYGTCQSCHKK